MSDEADLESSVNPEAGSPTRAAAFKALPSLPDTLAGLLAHESQSIPTASLLQA